MTDISLIGLGNMGAALARTLLASGRSVTVWNRTEAKADPLVAAGAARADTPFAAIAASPVVLACVKNHQATGKKIATIGTPNCIHSKNETSLPVSSW